MRKLMALGPYLMIEMLMPGGTVVAMLFYLAKRRLAKPVRNDNARL